MAVPALPRSTLPPNAPTPINNNNNSNKKHRQQQQQQLRAALSSCSSMEELRQQHSLLVRLGLSRDNDAVGRAIKFCALHPSGDPVYALSLFRTLPNPDPFVYNTLLRSHRLHPHLHPLLLYSLMLSRSAPPNRFTLPSLLSSLHHPLHARQVHAHLLKLPTNPYSHNTLLHLYSRCGLLHDARKVFDGIPLPDVVSWTTLLSAYSRSGLVDDARALFDAMPERNPVSWNTMIAAYANAGRPADAFALFDEMQLRGVGLDVFVAATMLSACAAAGALERGRRVHERIAAGGVEMDEKLATSVVDMYCKCGSLEEARAVFGGLRRKGLSTWNSMIGGMAVHGWAQDAIALFHEMRRDGVPPDGITLLNVLAACAHAGMVEEGRHYFHYVVEACGVEPKMEHFGCLVDLLGRAGLVSEAKAVVDAMPMEPDTAVLGALVGACRIHREVELGEEMGRRAIELDPRNSGRYVLLANLYATVGRWDDAANVRRLMDERGVEKEPGCSMIEMDGIVSDFFAGDRTHPRSAEIYAKLSEVLERIRMDGYVPETSDVLHDIEEEEKENPLLYHSEKLAISFGLLGTRPGETIRVSKNLRVCRDCHQASKFISKSFDREIILRDRNRFHHFKDGRCSCNDFW